MALGASCALLIGIGAIGLGCKGFMKAGLVATNPSRPC